MSRTTMSEALAPSPPPCGEGRLRGEYVAGEPPPQPSPTRGEGERLASNVGAGPSPLPGGGERGSKPANAGVFSRDGREMRGYARADGRLGIRNYVLVAYLVECAHHVARRIAEPFQERGA